MRLYLMILRLISFLFHNIIVETFPFLRHFCNPLSFNEFKWRFLHVNCSIKKEEIDLPLAQCGQGLVSFHGVLILQFVIQFSELTGVTCGGQQKKRILIWLFGYPVRVQELHCSHEKNLQ